MTVCNVFETLFSKVVLYFSNVNGLNSINLFEIGDDYIGLGSDNGLKLYGCKLESESNRVLSLKSMQDISNNIRYNPDESQVYIYFVKSGIHQGIYVYSFNSSAINQLTHDFNIKRLSGRSLVVSMYDIFLIGKYDINSDNRLTYDQTPRVSKDYFVPWDLETVSGKFQAKTEMAKEKMLNTGTMYQATMIYNRQTFDPVELFLQDWEGVIGMRIDFSPIATVARMKKYLSVAKFGDRKFHGICHAVTKEPDNQKTYIKIEEESCIVNCTAYLNKGSETAIAKISHILGFEFSENYLTGPAILGNTLMLSRDYDFDMLVPTDQTTQFFSTSHKKNIPRDKFVWWWGKDISGNYINYTIDDNTSPHVIYTGRTGAGKSRQAIAGLEQILGFDKDTGKALRFSDFKVRYTDVGYTCGNMAMLLKEQYPDDVKIYSSQISGMRFSLFDVDVKDGKADLDDLRFMIHLINFALEIQSEGMETGGKLSGGEMDFLNTIVKSMIEKGKHSNLYLREFALEGGYDIMLEEIYALGFTEKSKVDELPEQYGFLKKPILNEVLTEIDIWKKKSDYSDLEKREMESLLLKMSGLKNLSFLSFHSNVKKSEERFTHIDFDEIKDSPVDFSIIYWLMVKDWISIMKRDAKKAFKEKALEFERTLFYVDEAHNFFRYETFQMLLIQAVKEFRKYGGVFFFLSQELDDAPKKVITQIGTKIFVVPPEDKDALEMIIESYFGELKQGDKKVLAAITDYMMYMRSDKGSMGMKYVSDPADDWFYKPNHPDFLIEG